MTNSSTRRSSLLGCALTIAFASIFVWGVRSAYANGTHESQATGTTPAVRTLVVYSAGPKGLANKIEKGFEQTTGIKVEMFQSTTGKILSRIEAERSNPRADVIVLASWPSAQGLEDQGLLLPFPRAKNAGKLYWLGKENEYFGYSASALGIAYNTKLVKNPPKDWSDLTKPKWKDLVTFPDPALSGSALDFVTGYIEDYGTKGWELFKQLKANDVLMAGANHQALLPVMTGARDAVIAGVDYMTYAAHAKGEPVNMIYPKSGTVIAPRPAAILKSSKHVPEAKAFINYLLSRPAQELVAGAFLLPGRRDVPAKGRPSVSQIPVLKYNWHWMTSHNQQISARLTSLFQ